MMDGYGSANWGDWLGMGLLVLLWTALVVALAVWATRSLTPIPGRRGSARAPEVGGHDARIAVLEDRVMRLSENLQPPHRDGAGNR